MATKKNKPQPRLKQLLEDLTGEQAPLKPDESSIEIYYDKYKSGIGYSQFNEILLSFGYHRISQEFFQFLVDSTNLVNIQSKLKSRSDLQKGIETFRKVALFAYGNVRYAFKKLSTEPGTLDFWLEAGLAPIEPSLFSFRQDQIQAIQEIPGNDTYYLGYLIQKQIDDAIALNPNDEHALREKEKYQKIIEKGIQNYHAYLASDYIDVYVATSMREKHEYYLANKWINDILGNKKLNSLKLRWFDPTQAYCLNRVDKGLFEGLMLKMAKCTIYFIQETDTFGKDSELASTLAQGKPVIAFVPTIDNKYVDDFLKMLISLETKQDMRKIVLNQLQVFNPSAAWSDPEVQKWIADPLNMDLKRAKARLKDIMEMHYNRRSEVLSNSHPLGMQVNLRTGVANGVLVVRNVKDCVELVYRIMTRTMEFSLDEEILNNQKYVYLVENISKCFYRVVTGDTKLTSSFWNNYLNE